MKRSLLKCLSIACLLTAGSAAGGGASTPKPLTVPPIYRTLGGQYPDRSDPTRLLPRLDQLAAACIRYGESRNHPVDGNAWGSGAGWYQFTAPTWHSAAVALHFPARLMWDANLATPDQQSQVF